MAGPFLRISVALGVLLTVMVLPRPARGQSSVGVRVGGSLSTVLFEDPSADSQTESIVGLNAGVAVLRGIAPYASLEAGVQLSREGFRGLGAFPGTLRSDYVSIPLLLHLGDVRGSMPHLSLGVAPRFSLRCRQTQAAEGGVTACDDPVTGLGWRRFGAAGLLAVGTSLPAGRWRLIPELVLSLGLEDLNGDHPIPGDVSSMSLGIGFLVVPTRMGTAGGEG